MLLLCLLFVKGCGNSDVGPSPLPPVPPGSYVELALFSSPWCGQCTTDLPIIEREVERLTAVQRSKLVVVIYVGSGSSSTTYPSDTELAKYKQSLGTNFPMVADPFFKKIKPKYSFPSSTIPAAAIVHPVAGAKGYTLHHAGFGVEELMMEVRAALQ